VARLRMATRGSALARWQADHVASLLGVDVELVIIKTSGEQHADVPIREVAGRGVFVKEVQDALLAGAADVAVHSAKDLQSTATPGLAIGAMPERGDPRDALVGSTLDDLPTAGQVATGSVRRRAQLAARRPDLTFAELRGNIGTRLEKAAQYDAIVVAAAALERLGLQDRAAELLPVTTMVPQVGQGALAVECREDDGDALAMLRAIEHAATRRAVDAERAFLAAMGGGCDLPVGGYATVAADGTITLSVLLASLDGHVVLTHEANGDDPVALGESAARFLLHDAGGATILQP
jgi:hydroxymethylbilane synthase